MRARWFAEVLRAGLDTRVLTEQDILGHATPAVLTSALPREVMVRVIDATLSTGTMSHKAIVDIATVELLGEKVPAHLVWACIAEAADRAGIRDGILKDEAAGREFVRRALAAGLDTNVIDAKDIVEHVNAQVLGTSLPEALVVDLLETSLAVGKMSPELVVDTVGVDEIAKHVATNTIWAIFGKLAEPAPTKSSAVVSGDIPVKKPSAPTLDILDDSVTFEFVADEAPEAKPDPKLTGKPAVTVPPVKQPARPTS